MFVIAGSTRNPWIPELPPGPTRGQASDDRRMHG
jgi:hypothetical protein